MHLHFIATVRGHPASGLGLRRVPPLALHGLFLLLLPPLRLLLTRAQAKACSDVRTTVVEASDAGSGGGSALRLSALATIAIVRLLLVKPVIACWAHETSLERTTRDPRSGKV